MQNAERDETFKQHNPLIVIVSNRGPFSFKYNAENELTYKRGAGGLVTALAALAQQYDVLWVAVALNKADREWSKRQQGKPQIIQDTTIQLVRTDRKRYHQYYNIIANPLLWFIHHQLYDIPRQPTIDREVWEAWHEGYVAINRQLAEVVAANVQEARAKEPDRPVLIFPQDYHLYLMPHFLREILGHDSQRIQIQPFIHIPWPGPDAWRMMPSEIRNTVLTSLLESDRIGFQTRRDAFNFVQTCRFYLPDAHSYGSRDTIEYHGRRIQAVDYPISVDVGKVMEIANEPQTTLLKGQLINFSADLKRIVRVDRIEPSKNILRGLQAYKAMLVSHPEHRGKVQMLALLVPSRLEVTEYQTYWQEVMMAAGMINARFSDAMWEPVRIVVGDNYHRAIAALQIYDVLLVNPIADGMNLVAKEGVLVNNRDGVMLLSEHAGAYYELGEHAIVVNPFDVHGTAEAMHQGLTMPQEQRKKRADALRALVKDSGVHEWFSRQLADALSPRIQMQNTVREAETARETETADNKETESLTALSLETSRSTTPAPPTSVLSPEPSSNSGNRS